MCTTYAEVVKATADAWMGGKLPQTPSLRAGWLEEELRRSTKTLANAGTLQSVVPVLASILREASAGKELEHLQELLRWVDYRGSDVRLDRRGEGPSPQQFVPYPAFLWEWEVVQHYPWHQAQHINVLEYIAFSNYLRSLSNKTNCHSHRFFHIFDSRVVASVVAKGRSSSRRLNRIARRTVPHILGMDLYVHTLWTVSPWMPADGGSRLHAK